MEVTKEVLEVLKSKGRKEAYLYNNGTFWSNFISGEQYDFNHAYISSLKKTV